MQRAYRAMLLAGCNSGSLGDSGHSTLTPIGTYVVPFALHIPDEPTEVQVSHLLERLVFSISYFVAAEASPVSSGARYNIVPVMGICWNGIERDTVTVYFDDKPYLIPTKWLPFPQQQQLNGR